MAAAITRPQKVALAVFVIRKHNYLSPQIIDYTVAII